jgi:uncharacterized metal-binding protein
MTKTRIALWVLLIVSAVANIVTSTSTLSVFVGIGFGLLTAAFAGALVADHHRRRRTS